MLDCRPVFAPSLALLPLLFSSPVGECDPVDGDRLVWTEAERMQARERVAVACEATGAAPIVCAYYDTVVMRESRGRASVRHTRAPGENGLGAMGLSLRWQAHRWTGNADPDFCVPEVSLVVAHAIVWTAVLAYGAQNILEVQAVYSGRFDCEYDENGRTLGCWPNPSGHTRAITCPAMKRRGFDCLAPIARADLGRRLRKSQRAAFVNALTGTR